MPAFLIASSLTDYTVIRLIHAIVWKLYYRVRLHNLSEAGCRLLYVAKREAAPEVFRYCGLCGVSSSIAGIGGELPSGEVLIGK